MSAPALKRLVWNLPEEARRAPGALAGVALAGAIEQALDGALGQTGALGWGAAVQYSGDRETNYEPYVFQDWLRVYAGGVVCRLGYLERGTDQTPPAGVVNASSVFVSAPHDWSALWALHEQVNPALAALGYGPVSLLWPTTSDELFKRLEASGDAGLGDFIARCDAVMREVAASATHTLDLQHRPYLDLDALLRLAPPMLRWLNISHNELSALPEAVRRFTALESLDAYHNPLTALPGWLSELTSLRTLTLRGAQLDDLAWAALRAALPGVQLTY
jgi:hypothetical protein